MRLKGPAWSGYVKWMTQKLRTQFSNPVSSSLLPWQLTCIYAAPFRCFKSSLQHLSHSHTNLYTGGTNCSSQEVTYDALIRGFEITLPTLHSVDGHYALSHGRPVFPRHSGLFWALCMSCTQISLSCQSNSVFPTCFVLSQQINKFQPWDCWQKTVRGGGTALKICSKASRKKQK